MWFIAAVASAVIFGGAGLIMKISQMRGGSLNHLLLGLYITGTLGFYINSQLEQSMDWTDWRLWLAGFVVGSGSAWGNLVFMKALEYGPASLTSPLTNMNIVLIILMSVTIYHEPLSLIEMLGIALLLTGVVMISFRRKEPLTIAEKKWFFYVGLAILLFFFRNGGLKVTADLGLENTPILFWSYLLSAFWFGGAAAYSSSSRLGKPAPSAKSVSTGFKWGLLAGMLSYGGLQLYSIALQMGKANVVAPIFAANSLVIAVGSILLYKERLTIVQKIAVVLLFFGLVTVRL